MVLASLELDKRVIIIYNTTHNIQATLVIT